MSPPLQGLHRSYESVRPSAPLRYSCLAVLAACAFSLAIGATGSCSSVQPPDPTPLLQPHYRAFLARTSRSAPVLRIGTLASRFWPLALSPFTSERLVPAVPCNRLHPSHAPSTPAATRPVIRHLASLSQMRYTHLVSTTLDFLTTRPRNVYFRSSLGCPPARVFPRFSSNAHHHGS